jgi:serine/threonine protein kinase
MNPEPSVRHPVDELAEDFVARYRRGEHPSVSEYVRRYPELADQLSELLQALVLIEQLGPGQSGPDGALGSGSPVPPQLGEYRILREVGRGGMGVVYEAEQVSLGRRVALKVLPGHALFDPEQLERFKREARAAARLHHTNIVPVFGVGEQGGVHYYAMQFIQGQGLDQVIREVRRLRVPPGVGEPSAGERTDRSASLARSLVSGRYEEAPPPNEGSPSAEGTRPEPSALTPPSSSAAQYYQGVARVGLQAAEALAYAHHQGVVHRDVKPSNLLLDSQGTVWVTDFGLAKAEGMDDLTHTGDIVGTLRYLAPERLQGRSDPRGDVYSLGLTLYELLTLRPAFSAPDRDQLLNQLAREEPPQPRKVDRRIPRDLETIVLKAASKELGDRYSSARDLAEDLRRFLSDRPIHARRTSALGRLWRGCRRNPTVATLAATALITLLLGLVAVAWEWRRAEAERLQAEINFQKARDAVDECFTAVTADPVFQEPGLEPARQVLFRTALKYYQEFVAQRGEDPRVQADLAQAYARLGYILSQIGSPAEALAAYEQACALLTQLLRAEPTSLHLAGELARSRQRLGELCAVTGDVARAEAELRDALALREGIGRREPAFAENGHELADVHRSLGQLYRTTARPAQAETTYQQGLALRRRLLEEHPAAPAHRRALAEDYQELGRFYHKSGRQAEAKDAFQKALALLLALVQEHPAVADYQHDLAAAYTDLGGFLLFTGGPNEQVAAYRQALSLREQLVRDHPRVSQYQSELAKTYNNLGLVYALKRQRTEAEAEYAKALALRERLARDHPEIAAYQMDLARTHHNIGLLYSRLGDREQAEAAYHRALAVQERNVREHPMVTDFAIDLACTQNNLGLLAQRYGPAQGALDWYARAQAILERVVQAEPRQSDALRFLREAHAGRARTLSTLGREPEALREWELARAVYGWMPWDEHLGHAGSLARLGDHAGAAAVANRVAGEDPQEGEVLRGGALVHALCVRAVHAAGSLPRAERERLAEQYGARAVELLALARTCGHFRDPRTLASLQSDEELNSIRSRPDFQKLLAELEAKANVPAK